jgi:hypothetical protein
LNLVWLWLRSPHPGLAAKNNADSEPPHQPTIKMSSLPQDRLIGSIL